MTCDEDISLYASKLRLHYLAVGRPPKAPGQRSVPGKGCHQNILYSPLTRHCVLLSRVLNQGKSRAQGASLQAQKLTTTSGKLLSSAGHESNQIRTLFYSSYKKPRSLSLGLEHLAARILSCLEVIKCIAPFRAAVWQSRILPDPSTCWSTSASNSTKFSFISTLALQVKRVKLDQSSQASELRRAATNICTLAEQHF